MIHFLTVHHTGRFNRYDPLEWVELQNRFIQQYAPDSYVWACVNGAEEVRERAKKYFYKTFDFDPVSEGESRHELIKAGVHTSHSLKLHHLLDKVREETDPLDIIVFLDSDAWPVGDHFAARLLNLMSRFDFVFIKDRAQPSPHTAFFATTLESWDAIKGSWEKGMINISGRGLGPEIVVEVPEIGGKRLIHLTNSPQSLILDVTEAPYDPDFYCTYGEHSMGTLTYHHGAGSRKQLMSKLERIKTFALPDEQGARRKYMAEVGEKQNKLGHKVLEEIKQNGMEGWGT